MAPKKAAIYYYAKDRKQRDGIDGDIRAVIEKVYQDWKALGASEKAPYERLALEQREKEKNQLEIDRKPPPIAASSRSIFNDNPIEEKRERQKLITTKLEELIGKIPFDESCGPNIDPLWYKRWYFIKFVTFCRCDFSHDNYYPYYVLGEVAIVEYSLQEGIVNHFHSFIKPNTIPIGYRSACMSSSADVHKIPLDPTENAELVKRETYETIYDKICDFVEEKKEDNGNTPLFCMSEDIDETKFGLKYLFDQAISTSSKRNIDVKIKDLSKAVYDLELLVVALSQHKFAENMAHDFLTRFSYDYSASTKCDFHDDAGVIYCALGLVKRKAYLISDHLCPLYNIKVTEQHLPLETVVGVRVQSETSGFGCSYRQRGFRNVGISNKRSADTSSSGLEPSYDIRYEKKNSIEQAPPKSKSKTVAGKFEQSTTISSSYNLTEMDENKSFTNYTIKTETRTEMTTTRQEKDQSAAVWYDFVSGKSQRDHNVSIMSDDETKTSIAQGFSNLTATTDTLSTIPSRYLGRGRGLVARK